MTQFNIVFKAMDFVPWKGTSYSFKWPGPPRRKLCYDDVKHYKPIIELKYPAPLSFTMGFWAKEDYNVWSDPTLTCFEAYFPEGAVEPTSIRMQNHIQGPPRDLSDSPPYTYEKFWLGCGKGGRLRGNVGRGDDRHARIYLQRFDLLMRTSDPDFDSKNDTISVTGKRKSKKHTVKAKK